MMSQLTLDTYIPHFPDYELYAKIKYRNVRVFALNSKGRKTSRHGQFRGYGNVHVYVQTSNGFDHRFRHDQIVSIEVIP